MQKYNDGILFTTDKCIGCTKCISQCSILGANVVVVENGKTQVQVNSQKCNHCGKCMNVCSHNARSFRDDITIFFEKLLKGEKISLIVAPSFYLLYGDKAFKILGYLKSLGVQKIYDGSFGAEISIWAHVNYLKNAQKLPYNKRAFIAQSCPSLVNFIELYYPNLIEKIVPVQSPVLCMAIYARKYLGDTNEIALLSPCISKKDEILSPTTNNNIQYNISFAHLLQHIKDVDISSYNAKSDLSTKGMGNLIPAAGSFKDCIAFFFPRTEKFEVEEGFSPALFNKLNISLQEKSDFSHPFMVDILACVGGCQNGPGVEKEEYDAAFFTLNYRERRNEIFNSYKNLDDYNENFKNLNEMFRDLNISDFSRSFIDRSFSNEIVSDEKYDEIFNSMFKNTSEKRNVNCGSCGYKTCKDLATAIANGYNAKESCIHYMNEQMQIMLKYDSLTGLYNRFAFERKVPEVLKNNLDKKYVICFCDINRFKVLNDLYGGAVGNSVLQHVAITLKNLVGDRGFVARFSSDKFAIFAESSLSFLEDLRSLKTFSTKSIKIPFVLSAKFGLYFIDDHNVETLYLLNAASIAMDSATNKSILENSYTFFSEEMRENLIKGVEITSSLKLALVKDQFRLFFQPQYHVETGRLCGAEVLCRWFEDDGTVLSPSVFIPIAEKTGFIRQLDKIIWKKAFMSLRQWLDEGLEPVPLSINISRYSLRHDDSVLYIERLKREYKVPTELIRFEVTENCISNDSVEIIHKIERLRNIGFKIAMDDFGSGYSSLNSLKDLDIDILKLDMGFFGGKNTEKGYNIIGSVIRMAHALRIYTVAEGVETEDEANFLRNVGCDVIQGFYYAKPMNETEYLSWLKQEKLHALPVLGGFGKINVDNFNNPVASENIIFENYASPSVIIDFDGNEFFLVRINNKARQILKIENISIMNIQRLLDYVTKRKRNAHLIEKVQKAVETKSEVGFLLDLERIWIKAYGTLLDTTDSRHTFFVRFEDVTNEILAEKEVRLAKSQLELLTDNSVIGLCLIRFSFEKDLFSGPVKANVLKINDEFSKLSGFSEKELLRLKSDELLTLIHPQDLPDLIKNASEHARNKIVEPFRHTYRAKRKDGQYVWVKLWARAIKETENSYVLTTDYIEYTREHDALEVQK